MKHTGPLLALAAVLALAACGTTKVGDLLDAEAPAEEAPAVALAPIAEGDRPATLADRAAALDADLARLAAARERREADAAALRRAASAEVAAYDEIVKRMGERIAAGAAPRNPELLADWTEARRRIGRVDNAVSRLRVLGAEVGSDRSLAIYLRDAARGAQGLSGTDADIATLKRIEAGYGETVAALERLAVEIGSETGRQAAWADTERARADMLFAAIQGGNARAAAAATVPAPNAALGNGGIERSGGVERPVGVDGRRPFVVLRFDRPDVAFERPLFEAVQAAVSRQPDVRFDLVSISPSRGTDPAASRQNAEKVLKALVEMGLPANRVSLSARTLGTADTPQVHLYLRPQG